MSIGFDRSEIVEARLQQVKYSLFDIALLKSVYSMIPKESVQYQFMWASSFLTLDMVMNWCYWRDITFFGNKHNLPHVSDREFIDICGNYTMKMLAFG